jgi:autotransporter-associated beta strand protein
VLILATGAVSLRTWGDAYAAITATWLGTTDSNWATNTNWSGNVTPGQVNVTTNTDTAIFNAPDTNHRSPISITGSGTGYDLLNVIFDTANAGSYQLLGNLTLTNGGEVLMTPTDGSPQIYEAALLIGGLPSGGDAFASLINNAPSSSSTMFLGAVIEPAINNSSLAGTSTFYLGGTNTGQNLSEGTMEDQSSLAKQALALTKVGSGYWQLNGNEVYSGTTTVLGGTLDLEGTFAASGALSAYGGSTLINANATKVQTIGASFGSTVTIANSGKISSTSAGVQLAGGTLAVNNSSTPTANRLNNGALGMVGGTFNYVSGTGGSNSESTSYLNLGNQFTSNASYGGAAYITLNANASTATTLTATGWNRNPGASLLVTGTNFGATPAGNVTNFIASFWPTLGGSGTAGQTNIAIDAYMVGRDLAASGNAQYGFVTSFASTNGLRLLNLSSEYALSISDVTDQGTALRNISLTGNSVVNSSTTTINALRLDTGGSVSGTGTLTVSGGEILALSGNNGMSVGTIGFGSQEGIFQTIGNLAVSGNITGTSGLTKSGSGTLTFGASSHLNYTGQTEVNEGTVRISADNQIPAGNPLVFSGGALDLNGHNEVVAALYGQSGSSIVNSQSAQATLTIGGMAGAPGGRFAGTIGGAGGNNIALNVAGYAGSLQEGGGATFHSFLNLQGTSSYTGPTNLQGGELDLDFSEPNSATANIVPAGTALTDAGQIDFYDGQLPASQSFSGVTIKAGSTSMTEWGTGGMQVNLGSLSRSLGGTVDLDTSGTGSGFMTSTGNTNGIIGGYATLNEADWASVGAGGSIAAATYANNTWSPGANVNVTTDSTQTNATANSLRFSTNFNPTLTLNGVNVLTSGGIMVSTLSVNGCRISGGTLEGTAGGDLIINAFQNIEIDSVIADNGSGTGLTTTGTGTLTLTGSNTYTGPTFVNNGVLAISSNANLGSGASPVYINGGLLKASTSLTLDNGGSSPRPIVAGNNGAHIDVPSLTTMTIDGTISGSGILDKWDYGLLILSGTNSYTGGTTIAKGELVMGSAGAIPAGSPLVFGVGSYGGHDRGVLDLNGFNLTSGNISEQIMSGQNEIGNGSTTSDSTLTFAGSSGTFTGNIVDALQSGNHKVALVLATGSLALGGLTGGSNTYSGGTTIDGGATLAISDGGLPSNSKVVNNGALVIGGYSNKSVSGLTGNGDLTVSGAQSITFQVAANAGNVTEAEVTLASGMKLDLGNNHVTINYGSNVVGGTADPISTIRGYLLSGYNGGTWNGSSGIITSAPLVTGGSSYGLGYADSADAGNPAGLSSGQMEVKYTLLGDADLNGTVNGIDFGILAANFNKTVSRWDQGDFNYDGIVNGIDFTALAANFNKAASGAAGLSALSDPALVAFAEANGLMADVPEGSSLGISVGMVAGLLARRRRGSSPCGYAWRPGRCGHRRGG